MKTTSLPAHWSWINIYQNMSKSILTNSIKAWFLFAPTLHFVFTTLPNGFPSSISSSSVHSHGKFLKWSTLDGGWVYRNCGWLDTDAILRRNPPRTFIIITTQYWSYVSSSNISLQVYTEKHLSQCELGEKVGSFMTFRKLCGDGYTDCKSGNLRSKMIS